MSIVSEQIRIGLEVAIAAWGEQLTFLNRTITACVDRNQDQSALLGDIQSDQVQTSTIHIRVGDIIRPPRRGDVFRDKFGYDHRVINDPLRFDHHWQLSCVISRFHDRDRQTFLGAVRA